MNKPVPESMAAMNLESGASCLEQALRAVRPQNAARPVLRLAADADEGALEVITREGEVRGDAEERRKHRRFPVSRPGKAFRRATQQFQPVSSHDLSFSGALLEVQTGQALTIGEVIDLGMALSKNTVVPSAALVQAIVVRTGRVEEGRQAVAVRYLR